MPVSLVMTFIGRDRPGLVNAIASRARAIMRSAETAALGETRS